MREATFLIQADDRKGLLAEISGFFYRRDFNIIHCRQYTDSLENRYYMRMVIEMGSVLTKKRIEDDFKALAEKFRLEWNVYYSDELVNMAVMVSRTSHCLYDLLARAQEGDLPCRVPLIIGNHPELEAVADRFDIPFYCCPVLEGGKEEQEKQVLELLRRHRVNLVVLARYMQILSDRFISAYPMRIINIHHAFLPSFQGGNPYQRAWERGVKMIGATAHYATADLDEGPIIEQDVERIGNSDTPETMKSIGKDIERRVLTRAVLAHLEHRVITRGRRTVVFPR